MSDFDMQSVMQKATVIVRGKADAGTSVLAPDASPPLTINPIYQSFFNINVPDGKMQSQIEDINTYLDTKTPEELLEKLKDIRYKMGDSKPSLDKVHKYILLKKHAHELATASRSYEV